MSSEPTIVGHTAVVARLERALARDRLGHALLLTGTDVIAKEQTAIGLASVMVCTTSPRALPFGCGSCGACQRTAARAHPDVMWLMSERARVERGLVDAAKSPSADILVADVRELNREIRMRPYEATRRVAIIVDAHRMNANASNALLKTLEEPPVDTLLVLLAPHPRGLLPTIASRCQRLSFGPPRSGPNRLDSSDVDNTPPFDVVALRDALFAPDQARQEALEGLGRDREMVSDALLALEGALVAELRDGLAAATEEPLLRRAARRMREARAAIARNVHVQMALERAFLDGP